MNKLISPNTDPPPDIDHILSQVAAASQSGRLACKQALALAEKMGVSPREIGKAADDLQIKIAACQLGCFK